MVGVSRNTIRFIEKGQFNPIAKLALILCIALDKNLKGCNACGATLAETMEAAQEALGLYLTSLIERGIPLPEPSTLTQCRTADTFASYVTTNLDPYYRNVKAVRKTVSIPAWLADEAERKNLSLSKILQDGLKTALEL